MFANPIARRPCAIALALALAVAMRGGGGRRVGQPMRNNPRAPRLSAKE